MDVRRLGHLAIKHTRNAVSEDLYLRSRGGADFTRPTMIYGMVMERCNYKCRYCDYWRFDEYNPEMTIDEWRRALSSLKDFIGQYHIEFSGGEPFMKKGFLELIEWCHANDIGWGVTTNGSAFSEKIVKRVVAAVPFNVNVSIDAHVAEIHDDARGIDGSLERITKGLGRLIDERARAGLDFPIIIKSVVHELNFRILPDMVRWVQALGPTVINFQPVDRGTDGGPVDLWIGEENIAELERVAAELIRMKRAGAPILNAEHILGVWGKHFRGERAPPETLPCLVGLRNYFIRTNGDVEVCWFFPPIGNVRTQSAREIWGSYEAKQRRRETTSCDRLCLFTCLSQKTLRDKVRMGFTLISRSSNDRRPTQRPAPVVRAEDGTEQG